MPWSKLNNSLSVNLALKPFPDCDYLYFFTTVPYYLSYKMPLLKLNYY